MRNAWARKTPQLCCGRELTGLEMMAMRALGAALRKDGESLTADQQHMRLNLLAGGLNEVLDDLGVGVEEIVTGHAYCMLE